MKRVSAITLSLFLLLAGCAADQPQEGTPVTIYTLGRAEDRSALREETLYCPPGEAERDFALKNLFSPEYSAFPPGTTARDVTVNNGVVSVTLSEDAEELSDLRLTLARACAVLTLTELDGVSAVRFISEEQDILLRADDFILGSLVLSNTEQNVTLYFSNAEGTRTASETRILVVRETDTADRYLNYILEELIAGPRNAELRPVFPVGTRLLSVIVNGTDCTVNLSGEFLTSREGIPPPLTLTCLLRSVTAQEGIESLTLWIDGQPIGNYFGIGTSAPLTRENAVWLLP